MDTEIRVSTESRTLEKNILLPLQQGFEPVTFQSWVQHSNHWAIPIPYVRVYWGPQASTPVGVQGTVLAAIGQHPSQKGYKAYWLQNTLSSIYTFFPPFFLQFHKMNDHEEPV